MNVNRIGVFIIVASMIFASVVMVMPGGQAASTAPSWNFAFPMGGARSQATVVQADNGVVFVIGGYTTTAATETDLNSAFNPSTGAWVALAPLPLATRGASGGIGADGRIYVFDGTISGTQIYNISTNSWSAGAAMLPVGYAWEAKSAMKADKAYVFGGETSAVSHSNQTSIYNITTDSWSSGSDMPYGVIAGAVVADSAYAYYFGGENDSGLATTNSSRYNFATDTWSRIAPLPKAVCAEAAVIGPDGLVYVFGGANSAFNTGMSAVYSDTYTYDRSSNTWATVNAMNIARAWLGAAVSDNKVLSIGGNTQTSVYATVESLDTLQNQLIALQNQLDGLQVQVTLLQNQLAQANGNISSLQGQDVLLKAQLVALSAQLNQTRNSLTAALQATNNNVSAAKSAADNANTIGIIGVILAVVAIVIALAILFLKRKS